MFIRDVIKCDSILWRGEGIWNYLFLNLLFLGRNFLFRVYLI